MQQAFQVQGMSCGHCERAVTQAIQQVDPNAQVRVDLDQGQVEVQSLASRERLREAILDAGYRVQEA